MPMLMAVKPARMGVDMIKRIIAKIERPDAQGIRDIEAAVRAGFQDNFTLESRGDGVPWAPLAQRTVRERRALGFGPTNPILVRTGGYRATWVNVGGWKQVVSNGRNGWTMSVSSNHAYAELHELGSRTRNVPARPVRYLGSAQERRIAVAVDAWVSRILATTV